MLDVLLILLTKSQNGDVIRRVREVLVHNYLVDSDLSPGTYDTYIAN